MFVGSFRVTTLFILLVTLVGCAFHKDTVVKADGDTVQFAGEITEESAARFITLVNSTPIKRLVITSGGGSVGPALDMAETVFQHGIDVEVTDRCFSSCANYVFPAGREKIISQQGVVGWHGSITHLNYLHEQGEKTLSNDVLPIARKLSAREGSFYRKIGVNGFIAWFAKLPPYSVRNTYLLSKNDMERFGLRNIHVRDDYGRSDLSRFNLFGTDQVRFVHVDWASLGLGEVHVLSVLQGKE